MSEERGRTAVGDESGDRRGRSTSAHRNKHGDFVSSTGRGGAGNMMRSRSPPKATSEDLEGAKLAHEHISVHPTPGHPVSVGRGGAGNFRSPSRDPKERAQMASESERFRQEERSVERKHAQAEVDHPHPAVTGRGGYGNINGAATTGHNNAGAESGTGHPEHHRGVAGLMDKVRSFSKDRASSKDRSGSTQRSVE